MKPYTLLSRLLLVSLIGIPFPASGCELCGNVRSRDVVSDLQVKGVRRLPLPKDRLVLPNADGGSREIRVTLDETTYDGALSEVTETETREKGRRTLFCYELTTKDPEVPYAWSLWSYRPLAGFRLFSNRLGENYLAWVSGRAVFFCEVSRPADRSTRLEDFMARRPGKHWAVRVPVGDFVERVSFWGVDAFNADIRLVSVAKREDGNWLVKVSPPDSDEVFTLVSDGPKPLTGNDWHLE